VLDRGRVVERGTVQEVLGNPQHARTQELLAAVPQGGRPGGAPSSWGEPVLQAQELYRHYHLPGGRRMNAVEGVDLSLHRGEALGLVGTSGSGKSTLARLLVAAERPDRGSVLLHGQDWSSLSERRRRPLRHHVRLVPQDPLSSFGPRWNGERILRAAAKAAGRKQSPAELAALVHLPAELLQRNPRSLSGGQRQRLAIARALAARPSVLIL